MPAVHTLVVMLVGAFTGLLGGMFGKGGSAIATPLLAAVGVKPLAAVASPLPATIPATVIAAAAYARVGALDRRVLKVTVASGIPATIVGALLSQVVGGGMLVVACDILVAALGVRILLHSTAVVAAPAHVSVPAEVGAPSPGTPAGSQLTLPADGPTGCEAPGTLLIATGVTVGLVSGLLGNSGGFLLAPLFATLLGLPLKRALGTSLAAAAALAVPGTIVHAALGHIDWSVAIPFGLASIPLSAVGARIALRADAGRLEVLYGAALLILGCSMLLLA